MKGLERLDSRPLGSGFGEVRAFMSVRDERSKIAYNLKYHRGLGVDRFFVVDNESSDGTLEFLLEQPDCHVFRTSEAYASAQYGAGWVNRMMAAHGQRSWCLVVDADELFTYPGAEDVSIKRLCRHLDAQGDEGVFCLMLDMYGKAPISEVRYETGRPFTEACSYFDSNYVFRRRLHVPFFPRFPRLEAIGGPRVRVFYPEFAGAGALRSALPKAIRALRAAVPLRWYVSRKLEGWSAPPPLLTKIPLIKGAEGRYLVNSHRTTPLRLSAVTGVLLHFKYFSDFYDRAVAEAARGQHYDGASEYGRYVKALARDPRLSLWHEGSEVYQGTAQLVRLGLMRNSEGFCSSLGGRTSTTGAPAPTPWEAQSRT